MQKWLYHSISVPFDSATKPGTGRSLNEIGELGYELVSTVSDGDTIVYVFKKPDED